MAEQPFVKFRVVVGRSPAVVPFVGVFRESYVAPCLLHRLDHLVAKNDKNGLVSRSVKVPNRQLPVVVGPAHLAPAADRSHSGKFLWIFGGGRPSAEATLAQSRKVNAILVHGVLLDYGVYESGYDTRFPPQVGGRALGGNHDEFHFAILSQLGGTMLFYQSKVVASLTAAMKKDKQGPLLLRPLLFRSLWEVQQVAVALGTVFRLEALLALLGYGYAGQNY